jgi:hypothetical protein
MKKKLKVQPEVILHGECMVFAAEIPMAAQTMKVSSDYLIVADSETTGNHHVIDRAKGVEFLEHEGRRFLRNSEPTQIRCLHADRHDAIVIEPGTYEFGTQQEYDPFAQNLRNVRD